MVVADPGGLAFPARPGALLGGGQRRVSPQLGRRWVSVVEVFHSRSWEGLLTVEARSKSEAVGGGVGLDYAVFRWEDVGGRDRGVHVGLPERRRRGLVVHCKKPESFTCGKLAAGKNRAASYLEWSAAILTFTFVTNCLQIRLLLLPCLLHDIYKYPIRVVTLLWRVIYALYTCHNGTRFTYKNGHNPCQFSFILLQRWFPFYFLTTFETSLISLKKNTNTQRIFVKSIQIHFNSILIWSRANFFKWK